jgi:hypothetical protein
VPSESLVKARRLELHLEGTWGDREYIGLGGIEVRHTRVAMIGMGGSRIILDDLVLHT